MIRAIVEGYLRAGHFVHVVKFNRFAKEAVDVTEGNVRVTLVPRRTRGYQLTMDLWRPERHAAIKALRSGAPDVTHAQWTYEYALAAMASGTPYIVTARDVPTRIFRMVRPRYFWWPRLAQGFYVARRARRMTAQSAYTLECWRKEMGRKGPIDLIPNGIADYALKIGAEEPKIRSGASFAAISDGFTDRKNTKTLLQAFVKVRERVPDARLALFGAAHGPGEEVQSWAEVHGLAESVSFVGTRRHIDLLEHIHANASVLVHPALEESFGNAVLEGMALGLPVVGGQNAGAVPWLLDGGRVGVLCDVRDPEALAEAMLEADSSPQFGTLARQRAVEEFSLDRVVERYLTVLKEEADR